MKTLRRLYTPRRLLSAVVLLLTLCAIALAGYAHVNFDKYQKIFFLHTYKVAYTSAGFVPAYLSVPVGSRVAFTNETNTPMLVASDPYPSHTDYPAFVAPKIYAKGQTYVFTFNKGGTFGYDNDEKNADRGFVQVTDPMHPPIVVDETPPDQIAIRDKLLAMFVPGDRDSIFTVFDAIEADPSLEYNCHPLAHSLGHRAYELYGFSDAMTFDNPKSVYHIAIENLCDSGYMHGIIEEAFVHQPELTAEPGVLCQKVPVANEWNCDHGVGHALMFAYKRDITKSLAGCRLLGEHYETYCFEGAYMEFFWGDTDHSGPNSLYWDLNKPLAPCLAAPSDARNACFMYSSYGYLRTHPGNYTGAIHMCTQSGLDDTAAGYCVKGVGLTMLHLFDGSHLERAEPYAAGLTYGQKYYFYEGMLVYAYVSNISKGKLITTCNLMSHDSAVCLNVLSAVLKFKF